MSTANTQTAVIGLSDETLDQLRELRQLNVDSAKGFNECADLVEEHGVKQAFTEIAKKRLAHADALATQIEWNAGEESEDGSYLAAMHRAWIKVREACTSDDIEAIVAEAKRGETHLCEAYDDALTKCSGAPIRELLAEQYDATKRVCERLEGLCEAKTHQG